MALVKARIFLQYEHHIMNILMLIPVWATDPWFNWVALLSLRKGLK